ncbi:hypothetical protein [Yoonia sp. 2307UL14-13]|uniref:hypothetical protein n=1 Tax=Yoonia sp. 2307UL14-13 TaxID=3126506 RepID=UPI00309B557C
MQDNERLAALILDQISGEHRLAVEETEFVALLQAALQDGSSRLDLRDRLLVGARDSNKVTLTDIIEVMSQSFSDEIRDLGEDISRMESDLIPSRLALSSLVGLVLGTGVTLFLGESDAMTSAILLSVLGIGSAAVTFMRKRAFRKISGLRVQKANYENFRALLQGLK